MKRRTAEKIYFKETYKVLDSPFISDKRKVELLMDLTQELKEQVPITNLVRNTLAWEEVDEINPKLLKILHQFHEEGFGFVEHEERKILSEEEVDVKNLIETNEQIFEAIRKYNHAFSEIKRIIKEVRE